MLKGVNPNHLRNFYNSGENPISVLKLTPARYDSIDDEIYSTAEFRMYAYKIKKCTRTRSHDWTECPYAHRGEKATRRDPREVPYTAIACPEFRNGHCLANLLMEFSSIGFILHVTEHVHAMQDVFANVRFAFLLTHLSNSGLRTNILVLLCTGHE
jgi:hypothetical protein